MVRLQKAIADSGFCSRRKAEEYIVKGKVFVNGEKITELGSKVEGNEEIIVDGNAISKHMMTTTSTKNIPTRMTGAMKS